MRVFCTREDKAPRGGAVDRGSSYPPASFVPMNPTHQVITEQTGKVLRKSAEWK